MINHVVSSDNIGLLEKWQESLEIMGAITKEIASVHKDSIRWLFAKKPKSSHEKSSISQSILKNIKFLPIDIGRSLLISKSPDVIPVTYTIGGTRKVIKETKETVESNGVVCVFIQNQTSTKLQSIDRGFSYLAIKLQKPIIPVTVNLDKSQISVTFSQKMSPPKKLASIDDFCDDVISVIASNLPVEQRGKY